MSKNQGNTDDKTKTGGTPSTAGTTGDNVNTNTTAQSGAGGGAGTAGGGATNTGNGGGTGSGGDATETNAKVEKTQRQKLDEVIASLPGKQTDQDAVVTGLKFAFADEFTAEDEKAVRDAVPVAKKPDAAPAEENKPAISSGKEMVEGTENAQPKDPNGEPRGKKEIFRATHGGPIENPYTLQVFTGEDSKPTKRDTWIEMQLNADPPRLEVVTDSDDEE
jgi:hypothetical protein